MGRLHGVRLPPRVDLPHGLLLLSIYSPLQMRAQSVVREHFTTLMLEVVFGLDMQIPTIIFGDFNGSADPPADSLGATNRRRPVCPLLAGLLGPGGPFIDVHRSLLGESVPWTFRSLDQAGTLSASPVDLALANHAAMPLVHSATVMESVSDGGHSPVLLEFRLSGPVFMDWFPSQPQLPPLYVWVQPIYANPLTG